MKDSTHEEHTDEQKNITNEALPEELKTVDVASSDSHDMASIVEENEEAEPEKENNLFSNASLKEPSSMRTILQQFAEIFLSGVDQVMDPLLRVQKIIESSPHGAAQREILPGLFDASHHLGALMKKVSEQHAYVLIFGPLKSGKSTLMNAICSAYVSEVTALPAYPCLVHMSYAKKPAFKVTRYNGAVNEFSDQQSLYSAVEYGHAELIACLREVEESGRAFDPAVDMPRALRQIDVNLPLDGLATSGAVLVDTPGLYSRMKFGYDRMTRDFRNAAACAIFVVKSDNLFLEQVFDEFTDLLDLFSRIFLIVNLDSSKRDLSSKGELIPSLESQKPEKIIEAFHDLAMSAPLKRAADDGRLQIYAVDLLNAASNRIRAREEKTAQPEMQSIGDDFDALSKDLTDYLNSNDYLREFLGDSLRRANSLFADVRRLLEHDSLIRLADQLDVLRQEHKQVEQKMDTVQRLQEHNWVTFAAPFQKSIRNGMDKKIDEICLLSETYIRNAVNRWWESDESLHDLLVDVLSCKKKAAADYVSFFQSLFNEAVKNSPVGVEVDEALKLALKSIHVDIAVSGNAALKDVHFIDELPVDKPAAKVDEIPVKRTFLDWLFFRSLTKIRRILFGPLDEPKNHLSASVKQRRLMDSGQEKIKAQLIVDFKAFWSEEIRELPVACVSSYLAMFSEKIGEHLKMLSVDFSMQQEQLRAQLLDGERILGAIQHARDVLNQSSCVIDTLSKTYGNRHAGPQGDALVEEPWNEVRAVNETDEN